MENNNVNIDRQSMPNEHLGWAAPEPESNPDEMGYTPEELDAIDNPAEPTKAESVANYLGTANEEGSELWTHLWEGSRALDSGNIEDGAAHLRILIEIFQTLLNDVEGSRTAKTAASEPLGLDVRGWTLTDYQWQGGSGVPDHLEYALLEHPTQGMIQANGIDVNYDGGTVNSYWQNHGGPGLDEHIVDIDRGDTQASFASVDYFSPQNDNDIPDATYSGQDAPSDIIDIVNSYISEDQGINETLDDYLAENPPEPDWDSMPGGADW